MIEISLGKLMLLALIALVVLGPEKLPNAARSAGVVLRRLRSGWDNVRVEAERELEVEEVRRTAREAAAKAEAAQAELDAAVQKVRDVQHVVVAPDHEAVTGAASAAAAGPAIGAEATAGNVPEGAPDPATGDLFAGAAATAARESPHGRA
ncbi:Sec-independent protein translocase protein TatB [Rhodanobacter denitrificans]|uniref:Sec-independent protein translocase protein TatB n=1 Tax=Rhodanobacter denitrificans TaxID=666685 RepID=UPI000260D990|nr:Sec-independent protein translocase protein TatB [Rhodanobacter denitrificans]EIM00863.1 twin arginine-targeting protein translocase TatB [Rhodanobacter denitrificans]UJM90708.1 Sec-independent protein translocase protein TatB [Rhodanobacter denitrificans]